MMQHGNESAQGHLNPRWSSPMRLSLFQVRLMALVKVRAVGRGQQSSLGQEVVTTCTS